MVLFPQSAYASVTDTRYFLCVVLDSEDKHICHNRVKLCGILAFLTHNNNHKSNIYNFTYHKGLNLRIGPPTYENVEGGNNIQTVRALSSGICRRVVW
jgi:hypothetical protein